MSRFPQSPNPRKRTAGFVALWFVFCLVVVTGWLVAVEPEGSMRVFGRTLWAGFFVVAVAWAVVCVRRPGVFFYRRVRFPDHAAHTAIRARSSRRADDLTLDELGYMIRAVREEGWPRCPDCGRRLCSGPSGCASMNMACRGCGAEFNVTFLDFGRGVSGTGERNSDAGPRELGDRDRVYSLEPADPTAPTPPR